MGAIPHTGQIFHTLNIAKMGTIPGLTLKNFPIILPSAQFA